jgi:hypothetical protein
MLNRSIPTRKALVHSILNNEVKDMKNDVLRVLKASFFLFFSFFLQQWTLYSTEKDTYNKAPL